LIGYRRVARGRILSGMKKLVPILAVLALYAPAHADNYRVTRLDFDIWCTEIEHLPGERCDQHLADDMGKFEAYRAMIEKYEVPYLQSRDRAAHFDRTIMHYDPVDKTLEPQPEHELPAENKSP
jgi:hypothetical protein